MGTGETTTDKLREPQSNEGYDPEEPSESNVGWRHALDQIKKDTTARIGFYIIAFILGVAIFAWIDAKLFDYAIASRFWYNPVNDPANAQILLPPAGMESTFGSGTWKYPLGTDHRGRDILVRLVYGTRIAMQVGIVSTGFGLIAGTLVGAVAGYHGGRVDDALMRLVETLYAIPFLVLVIAFMAAFGRDLTYAMIGVGITTIPVFARLIRSRVVSVREEEYIEAARAAGVRDRNIILRHVIPNSFAPVLVQATLQVGISILIVAGLSFLGFGAQPPTPSWGQMLNQSRGYMLPDPWFSLWPGIAILITVMGFNLLGDGLRDALDPRIKN
ncbi:peptide/nickel transport system permease protein [Haladaptatus litoreus]|uniref:Peptide/nickel transport system permease protein n=1 Tax=Haladaptatus litoreus TaxID=553468 RepID=A0A1N6W8J7_9EURY|nr:ABC transporter permease [Haladaptatus litoreus]SIQ86451.1 peptide/nickel transport system permease protein [Haladaptatus litoreus]